MECLVSTGDCGAGCGNTPHSLVPILLSYILLSSLSRIGSSLCSLRRERLFGKFIGGECNESKELTQFGLRRYGWAIVFGRGKKTG